MWCRNPLLRPSCNNFTYGHLLKIDWLVTDVTSVGSPNRAECDIFGVILDVFWPVQAVIVDETSVGSPATAEHDIFEAI